MTEDYGSKVWEHRNDFDPPIESLGPSPLYSFCRDLVKAREREEKGKEKGTRLILVTRWLGIVMLCLSRKINRIWAPWGSSAGPALRPLVRRQRGSKPLESWDPPSSFEGEVINWSLNYPEQIVEPFIYHIWVKIEHMSINIFYIVFIFKILFHIH